MVVVLVVICKADGGADKIDAVEVMESAAQRNEKCGRMD